MAESDAPGLHVVAALLADVDDVGIRRERVAADREHVGGIREVAPLEHADDQNRQILDAWIEAQSVKRARLDLAVVDVRVAAVPALLGQVDPALERRIDVDRAGPRGSQAQAQRRVLGAALDDDLGGAAGDLDLEAAVAA